MLGFAIRHVGAVHAIPRASHLGERTSSCSFFDRARLPAQHESAAGSTFLLKPPRFKLVVSVKDEFDESCGRVLGHEVLAQGANGLERNCSRARRPKTPERNQQE